MNKHDKYKKFLEFFFFVVYKKSRMKEKGVS